MTWHSRGFQLFSLENPGKPRQLAQFMPDPRPVVQTEDPALSMGRDKVVMWSYPIVRKGLIYQVDLRNGLYALRYRGCCQEELAGVRFLEGNSNLGDALRFERSATTAGYAGPCRQPRGAAAAGEEKTDARTREPSSQPAAPGDFGAEDSLRRD